MTIPVGTSLSGEMARLARQLSEMQQRITQLERGANTATLANASIEGGALVINDSGGTPQIVLGAQADGTFAHVAINSTPPPPPSAPVVAPAILSAMVSWDGTMADGTPPLSDFTGVQVHCSAEPVFTPGVTTQQSTFIDHGTRPVGGLLAGHTYYICLVTVNAAGQTSDPSAIVTVVPTPSVTTGQVINQPVLMASTTLGYTSSVPRGPVLYDFEFDLQGWAAVAGGTLTQSSAWAGTGQFSALLTASGTGSPSARSPSGFSGIPVTAGDPVDVQAVLYVPAAVANLYASLFFYDSAGNFISETDSDDVALSADTLATFYVNDNAPADGFAAVGFGNHGTLAGSTLIYCDTALVAGNLAFSFSAVGGADQVGNIYGQGIQVNGLQSLTSVFTVQDSLGRDVTASIDVDGNVTGLVGSFSDVYAGGQSLLNDILPELPQGLIAYGHPSSYPSGHFGTTEGALMELDVDVKGGRAYFVGFAEATVQCNSAGHRGFMRVRKTEDGSTPTTGSPVLWLEYLEIGQTNFLHPGVLGGIYQPTVDCTARLLVTVASRDGSPEWTEIDDGYLYVEDIGPQVGNNFLWLGSSGTGTSGGTTPKTYTKTYTCVHSYSYQGSDGGNPNQKINTDGTAYQGGDRGNTYNGRAKTFFLMPSGIASDLSGAALVKTELYLNNNHSWYNSGMTASIGWSTDTSFGSTKGDPTTHDSITTEHFNEGQAKWFEVPGIGTAFRDSGARCVTIFRNSNSLTYYGYFSGGGSAKLRITYTK